MFQSIPECSWRLDASDPKALTRLLDLPGLVVTSLEYNDVQESLHHLKEAFRTLFERATELKEAEIALEAWIASVETSGLAALLSFVALLRKRWEHILNYFHTRLTSGGVEGLNNKIKVVKRCAYGFGNFE